ncbi:MAG: hypothetical protein K0U80_12505 [Actinomycetia bacterium]|nr:hypothetical protein [Actinomycetes bacterium]MCH9759502.1 hypothetical protein [Actinomycetes bacterium]
MVAVAQKSTKFGALGAGALAVSFVAMTFGSGIAGANPNDPGMDRVGGNGTVSSRQADSTSGAKHCEVGTGTLSTASTHTPDMGAPKQTAKEAGPSWVGSDGWQAIGLSPSNPWRGQLGQTTRTGPQCKQGRAHDAGSSHVW